jgi:hypothetical protein
MAPGIMVDDAVLAKKKGLSKMTLPGYNGINSLMLRVAFPANGLQIERQLIVSGKMGGLKFTKQITTARDAGISGDAANSVQWAFRKAENLAQTQWDNNWNWDHWKVLQDSVKAVGYAYHIVTANTALLALEPGMTLSVDSTMAQAQASANATDAKVSFSGERAAVSRQSISETGPSLDDVSLEDLIAGKMPVINNAGVAKTITEFMVAATKSRISIAIPAVARGTIITLSIYDLKGRMVFSRKVSAQESTSGAFVWNLSSGNAKLSKGFYALRITTGAMGAMFKLPVVW